MELTHLVIADNGNTNKENSIVSRVRLNREQNMNAYRVSLSAIVGD